MLIKLKYTVLHLLSVAVMAIIIQMYLLSRLKMCFFQYKLFISFIHYRHQMYVID